MTNREPIQFPEEMRAGLAEARRQAIENGTAEPLVMVDGELHFRGDIRDAVAADFGLKGPHPIEGWLVPAYAEYDEETDLTTVSYRRATVEDRLLARAAGLVAR